MCPILKVAKELCVPDEFVKPYGKWKAKVSLAALQESNAKAAGKLVLVTGMTPTPSGEEKTVTSIGVTMELARLGRKAVLCLRQPSLGPFFGIKGGAAGGGKSTALVRRLEVGAGAGFNIAYGGGDVVTMPGLPKRPAAENIDLTDEGIIIGWF